MNDFHKPWYLKWWGLIIAATAFLVLCFLSAFGFYVIDKIQKLKEAEALTGNVIEKNNILPTDLKDIDLKDNYWIGSAEPKLTVVEFGDFSCPYCRESFAKFRELSVSYKKDIRFVYADYPVVSDLSTALALAARCAGEQGLFWAMHDRLYVSGPAKSLNDIYMSAMRSGVDIDRFKICFDSEKYINHIKEDYLDGQKLGITGTPTWFLNGYRIEGDMPFSMMEEIVKGFLD